MQDTNSNSSVTPKGDTTPNTPPLSALTAWLTVFFNKTLHIPANLTVYLIHAIVVFVVSFGTQVYLGAAHHLSWDTLWQLVAAAAMAGLSAVAHYVMGLIETS